MSKLVFAHATLTPSGRLSVSGSCAKSIILYLFIDQMVERDMIKCASMDGSESKIV